MTDDTDAPPIGGIGHVRLGDITYYYKAHAADEGFDRIEVRQYPRWKESELSGDEYRWSYLAEAFRKGDVIAKGTHLSLFDALIALLPNLRRLKGLGGLDECAQPECENEPDVLLRLKAQFDRSGSYRSDRDNVVRAFCRQHLHRGDCSMEDNDENYERLALRVDGAWVPYPGEETS